MNSERRVSPLSVSSALLSLVLFLFAPSSSAHPDDCSGVVPVLSLALMEARGVRVPESLIERSVTCAGPDYPIEVMISEVLLIQHMGYEPSAYPFDRSIGMLGLVRRLIEKASADHVPEGFLSFLPDSQSLPPEFRALWVHSEWDPRVLHELVKEGCVASAPSVEEGLERYRSVPWSCEPEHTIGLDDSDLLAVWTGLEASSRLAKIAESRLGVTSH